MSNNEIKIEIPTKKETCSSKAYIYNDFNKNKRLWRQNITLRRLKYRYDEIKKRDEVIKTDYFKIIMRGLEERVIHGILETEKGRTQHNLEFLIHENNKDDPSQCACYSPLSAAFLTALLDITGRRKEENKRQKNKKSKKHDACTPT